MLNHSRASTKYMNDIYLKKKNYVNLRILKYTSIILDAMKVRSCFDINLMYCLYSKRNFVYRI